MIVAGMAAAALVGGSASAQDAAAGKKVFMRCIACHAVQPGAGVKMGPNLAGVAGRKAAAAPGFKYSAAMQKAKLKWDDATLDKWLTRPAAVVPGTSMAFAGLPNAADRANVIAYLKKPN
nr:cytochrome c family protein [Novosphingobium taihuense]